MAEPVQKDINGHAYEIKPFNGMTGWRMQARLGKMIGPAIREALGALPKGKVENLMSSKIDPAMFGGAAAAFVDAIATQDPDGKFAAELLSYTTRDGVPVNISEHYAANYAEMFKALIAVVQANDFFGIGSFGFQGALETAAQASPAN